MPVSRKRLFIIGGVGLACAAAAIITAIVLTQRSKNGHREGDPPSINGDSAADSLVTSIRAIHPRMDSTLTVSVQQILSVEPLFQAELRAQVAGVVLEVPKSIGDHVGRNEVLVRLDVPQLLQELRQKEAIVFQRDREEEMSRALVKNAEAMKEIAKEIVPQREAEKKAAIETREFRKLRLNRFVEAAKKDAIQQTFVDEEYRNYMAAAFTVDFAAAAIRKANADVDEKNSAIRVAETDVKLKTSLVEVARRDRDHTQALMDFAQITAPFDGVIVARNVQPGTLVQNASTGLTPPLLTLARTDIVTLVMKVPDDTAPYVAIGTEAEIQIDKLPGVVIRGKVTRFSPLIVNKDRTMRVEVDLYNDSREQFNTLAAACIGTWLPPLALRDPLQELSLYAFKRELWSKETRSVNDPFPMWPIVSGKKDGGVRLIPGMTGYMRLNLRQFHNVPLIPNSAVFTRGGKPYIAVVENEVVRRLPVRLMVNDGRVARVLVIVKESDPSLGQAEETRELTTGETIVLSRQTELMDGQRVQTTIRDW